MAEMALCPKCDNMILPGTTVCPYCGAEMTADGSLVQPPGPQHAPIVAGPVATSTLQETLRTANLPQTDYAEPWSADQLHRIEDLNPLVTTRPAYTTTEVTPAYQPEYQVTPYNPAVPVSHDRPSFWWGVLGFAVPVAGFIMWFMWKGTMPQRSRSILIGSICGLLFGGGLGGQFF